MILRALAALALVVALAVPAQGQQPAPRDPAFEKFLGEVWKDAQAKGITRATFDKAFAGVTPDPRVIATTKKQPEYNKPAGLYVNQIASPVNAKTGLRKEAEWRTTFDAIEKKYQVERWVILAIWGMETSYGALKDKWDGIRSLATLAFAKYRDPYFRNELLVALKIIQDGHISREKFVSSWAGAMGQTQFMPTNFVDYAVDFNGDGRRDIWTNVPDVLASTANYFAKAAGGWKMGVPWGFEVLVPARLRPDEEPRDVRRMDQAWRQARRRQGLSSHGRRHPVFSGRPARPRLHRHAEFRGHQGLQRLRCLRARHRSSLRPDARRQAPSRRRGRCSRRSCPATTGSRCRKSWPRSATIRRGSPRTSTSRCAISSAPSRRSMVSSPTASRTQR